MTYSVLGVTLIAISSTILSMISPPLSDELCAESSDALEGICVSSLFLLLLGSLPFWHPTIMKDVKATISNLLIFLLFISFSPFFIL